MEELSTRASKNFDKYLKAFQNNGERNLLPIGRLSESEWKQLSVLSRLKYGVGLEPVLYRGIRYMGFVNRSRDGVDILREYTGRNWEYKEKSGLGYSHYRIPLFHMDYDDILKIKSDLDRLNFEPNIETTNKGVFLVVRAENMRVHENDKEKDNDFIVAELADPNDVEPVAYGYAPAVDAMQNENVAPGKDKDTTNIGHNLRRYTGYDWEHKTESGLGYEHYRLPIKDMSSGEIQRIMLELEKRAIYPKREVLNKGVFLIFNTDAVRNRAPEKYHGGKNMLANIYNANVAKKISPDQQQELNRILNTPLPDGDADIHSPVIVAHTRRIVNAYAQAGVLDLDGIHKMAYDMRNSAMLELSRVPEIVDGIKNWNAPFMTKEKRRKIITQINYILGGLNRNHEGNTILLMGDNYYAGGGFNGSGSNVFSYSTRHLSDFDYVFGKIVHENIHGYQKYNRTSFSKDANNYISSIKNSSHQHYVNNIEEAETRYVQDLISKDFKKDFMAYVAKHEYMRSGGFNR
ncbi:MAG: hypothetical protein IJY99_02230 [Alphaproteobacteria bacterium]|nr:hypothetical protein [Alphaproteobacteria bacterium]